MEVRGIFIFNNEALVYKQVYPLIEKQVKAQFGSNYYESLPEPNHLQDYIKKKRESSQETFITFKEPVEIVNLEEYKPSEADKNNIKQIFHKEDETLDKYFDEKHYLYKDLYLTIGSKKWLTLTFQRNDWTLFMFPREETAPNSKEFTFHSVINNVNIYASVQFGKKFIEFMDENMSKKSNIEDSIDFILLNCIPFGRILTDHFMPFLVCLTDGKTTLAIPNTQENKLPSHQDKFIIQDPIKKATFSLEERIINYQFNKENVTDFVQIEGKIKCKVDSISDEEISVTILNLNEEKIALTTHGVIEKSLMPNQIGTKITFSIPDQKEFDICHYTFGSIPTSTTLPITGSYCRKQLSETQIGLGVELDIHEKWRPFIKDLKFQIRLDPFKTIAVNNLIASDGKIEISQSKLIIWSLPRPQDVKGQITIKGSLSIEPQSQSSESENKVLMKDFIKELSEMSHINQHKLEENDLLFCLPDRYIEVGFDIADNLLSDVGLNPNQVVIFPTRKLDIKVQKHTKTWRYFIFLEDDNEFRPLENNLY